MLVMSRNLRAADGAFLRAAGYTVTFTTGTQPSSRYSRRQAVGSNRANSVAFLGDSLNKCAAPR